MSSSDVKRIIITATFAMDALSIIDAKAAIVNMAKQQNRFADNIMVERFERAVIAPQTESLETSQIRIIEIWKQQQ